MPGSGPPEHTASLNHPISLGLERSLLNLTRTLGWLSPFGKRENQVSGKTSDSPRPHCCGVAGLSWKLNRWYLKAESGFEREVTSIDVIMGHVGGVSAPYLVQTLLPALPAPSLSSASPPGSWLQDDSSPAYFSEFLTRMSASTPCLGPQRSKT